MNIAPILRIRGKARSVSERQVEPAAALPERTLPPRFDRETGAQLPARTLPAQPAREGYTVHDVVVDTDPGGFVTVVFRDEAVADAGGYLPAEGEVLDVPVRAFNSWQTRRDGTSYTTPGYSFAGKVYAAEAKARTGGARAAVSAVS